MRLVERPSGRPGFCAVISGKAEDPEGFIFTGQVIPGWDPEVCVSVTAVREMSRVLGWPTPEDHAEVSARAADLEREVDDLRAQLREADKLIDAIDVFESAGFTARKKPGRPKKEAA